MPRIGTTAPERGSLPRTHPSASGIISIPSSRISWRTGATAARATWSARGRADSRSGTSAPFDFEAFFARKRDTGTPVPRHALQTHVRDRRGELCARSSRSCYRRSLKARQEKVFDRRTFPASFDGTRRFPERSPSSVLGESRRPALLQIARLGFCSTRGVEASSCADRARPGMSQTGFTFCDEGTW